MPMTYTFVLLTADLYCGILLHGVIPNKVIAMKHFLTVRSCAGGVVSSVRVGLY